MNKEQSKQTVKGIGHPYVERRPDIDGGKAVVAGTRIKVTQIALEFERLGWTADQIIDAHPHLTLPQVHDALSYYYENQAELDAEMMAEEEAAAELRRRYTPKIPVPDAHQDLHE